MPLFRELSIDLYKNAAEYSTGDSQSLREISMTLSIKLRPWRPLKHEHLRGSVRKRQFS